MNTLIKCFFFSVVMLFNVFPFTEVLAESNENYQSTGDISFYGTYEYPDKAEILPPSTLVPNGKLPVEINTDKSSLTQFPQTSEVNNYLFGLIGLICIVLGINLYYKQLGGNKNETN
ncbi:conserved exported hypothetical protein [Carnobacterium maltaromaticum]|uniref:LPXTG cell wall anchor domain-containing protein n=1 Tax=Carnobacterium maltaromaticum TaxID=2751 RepID=A0AAW9K4M7_CARML|nr:LPXTG cell wall anchor domain-containing protein [Carnobacterium maltaromaticum]MDZ5759691.1 LPXTG cell wall anchor domain-containing protein [Carnobacterium maltaromaticum]CAD5896716.1 conserved exported hypothetical protein [Carnobacterium maltaromaticum]